MQFKGGKGVGTRAEAQARSVHQCWKWAEPQMASTTLQQQAASVGFCHQAATSLEEMFKQSRRKRAGLQQARGFQPLNTSGAERTFFFRASSFGDVPEPFLELSVV